MIQDYVNLAIRNLRRRGLRSYLTLLGILIGITAVVALITLGNGLREAVISQFGISSTEVIGVQAGGVNAFGPPGSGVTKPLQEDDVEAIEKLSIVDQAVRRNIPTVRMEYEDEVIFGIAMSIPDGDDRDLVYKELNVDAVQGRLLKDGDTNKVVLGNNFLTGKAGLNNPVEAGDKVEIQGRTFEVVGITEKKGSFIFDNVIHVNDKDLESIAGYGDNVDLIVVKVRNSDDIDRAKEEIEDLMRERRDVEEGEEDFEVSTPEAELETVNEILSGIQIFIVMIAFIAIIVGAIGIVNTMTTSVLERKKEIGVMKAIGAKNSDVFLQFFIESGLLGLVGGIIGVILGLTIGISGIIGINNFLGSSTSPKVDFVLVILTLLGSFLIGSISGIAPALRAANQNPVEALRS